MSYGDEWNGDDISDECENDDFVSDTFNGDIHVADDEITLSDGSSLDLTTFDGHLDGYDPFPN